MGITIYDRYNGVLSIDELLQASYYYYDKESGCMYVNDSAAVYYLKADFKVLCELYYGYDRKVRDSAWLRNFGKTPMGICSEYKLFGLKPCSQVQCEYIRQWIDERRSEWVFDLPKSIFYGKVILQKFIDSLFKFL